MRTDIYQSPLCERYASKEMQSIFSHNRKFGTWRRLWVALAESEQELGLPISDEQIEEMKAQIDNIDYEKARQYERELRLNDTPFLEGRSTEHFWAQVNEYYNSALRADISLGEEYESGFWDQYYDLNDELVQQQIKYHGEY